MANRDPFIFKASDLITSLLSQMDIYEILGTMIDNHNNEMETAQGDVLTILKEELLYLIKTRDLFKSLRDQQLRELGI